MNFLRLKVAFVGTLLMIAPAFAQTSVEPIVENPQIALASAETPVLTTPGVPKLADDTDVVDTVSLSVSITDGLCPLPPTTGEHVDWYVVDCHAYRDPIPKDVPTFLEKLEKVCGKAAVKSLSPRKPCALVFSKIQDGFALNEDRPPYVMTVIHRMTNSEDLAHSLVLTINPDGRVKQLGPGEVGDLISPKRVTSTEKKSGTRKATTRKNIVSPCENGVCPRYYPVFLLGLIENPVKHVLSPGAEKLYFRYEPQLVEDVVEAMENMIRFEIAARKRG